MSAPRINYVEIFEELSHPVGMCDADGNLLLLSRVAREMLGVDSCEDVSLDLAGRDTFSELRVSGLTSREYFLADVPISDAARETVSVTLTPLSNGDFQLVLHEPAESAATDNPSVELLRNLCSFEPHVTLFRTAEELVGLYASAFRDVFPNYAFVIRIDSDHLGEIQHTRSLDDDPEPQATLSTDAGAGPVDASELLWDDSMVGQRVCFDVGGRGVGVLQVEATSFEGFEQDHIPAFEAFGRQLAEEVSRRSSDPRGLEHDLLAPVLDGLNAMVVVCDEHRIMRACNESFESALSRDAKTVLGRDLLDFIDEDDRAELRVAAASAIAGECPEPLEIDIVGANAPLRVQVSPLRERESTSRVPRPRGFVVFGRGEEVSLAEIEQQIERAEHLMTLGELATGVAHELKNPLTSILNYAEYLLQKYDDDFFEASDRDRLKRIVDGVERMDHFVRDLLQLARPDQGDMRPVNLGQAVKRAVQVVRMSVSDEDVSIDIDLGPSPVRISGMSGQLEQLFVNLISNAVHALDGEPGFVRIEMEAADGRVKCRVVDNAGGMSEDTVARIFEPFFTTRSATDGTGLGLALVRAIVERHQGEIDVDSQIGEGTTFTIDFPMVEGDQ